MSNIPIKSKVPRIKQFTFGHIDGGIKYHTAAECYEAWLSRGHHTIEVEAIHMSDDGKTITIFYNSVR